MSQSAIKRQRATTSDSERQSKRQERATGHEGEPAAARASKATEGEPGRVRNCDRATKRRSERETVSHGPTVDGERATPTRAKASWRGRETEQLEARERGRQRADGEGERGGGVTERESREAG